VAYLTKRRYMRKVGRVGYPFIALGISFLVIGFSGHRAFIGVGVVFLLLGIVTLKRG
jgi:hypothetical protein